MARTYVDKKGYRRFVGSNKLVSRWVAGYKLGRPLKKGDVVHHGHKGKGINNPNNLWVFPKDKGGQKAHHAYHLKCKKKTGSWLDRIKG